MKRRIRIRCTLLVVALTSVFATSLRANPQVYENLLGSTVYIKWSDGKTVHWGSGVLIDLQNRLIVTAQHVVADTSNVVVYFPACDDGGSVITEPGFYSSHFDQLTEGGIAFVGRVVERAKNKDLALLQIKGLPANARAIPLSAGSARPGDNVHSIGNSSSEALWRYTPGQVRNVYRQRDDHVEAHVVETTSPINGGDSGGPMVNDAGELIGIVVSAYLPGSVRTDSRGKVEYVRGSVLVSFAIDVREVRWLLQSFTGHDYDPNTVASAGPRRPIDEDATDSIIED